METASILDFLCSSWEHNIFVGDCPNSINICMLLPESIPQGETKIFCIFKFFFYNNVNILYPENVSDCIHSCAII